jgi:hypothetical protein
LKKYGKVGATTQVSFFCMKKRVALPLLLLVLVGVIASHLGIKSADNSHLLVVDGREIDVLGKIQNQWVAATTSCQSVAQLHVSDPPYAEVAKLIQSYSPPSSQSAQIASLWTMGAWTLAEVEFKDLVPSVVALQTLNGKPQILPRAIWSGYTRPWVAAPFIRHYLATRAPEIPITLLNCFKPNSRSFH